MRTRIRLSNALKEAKGAWSDEDYPEFKTQEDISRWVRSLREIDTNRLKEKAKIINHI